ncbi:MAG: hypothetical protein IPL47_12280 [Phyllobacteriaceae bacterium]|nr:hypothetical protein [Phyllobacteriaceae bacterium]
MYRRALKLDKSISLATVYRTMKCLRTRAPSTAMCSTTDRTVIENAAHEHWRRPSNWRPRQRPIDRNFHSDRIEALQGGNRRTPRLDQSGTGWCL